MNINIRLIISYHYTNILNSIKILTTTDRNIEMFTGFSRSCVCM